MRLAGCVLAAGVLAATPAAAFEVTSPAFDEGERLAHAHVYQGFGCEDGNVAPALSWSGAPEGTESFALTVHDPDAPKAGGWWHWLVVNLPADTTHLPRGAGSGDLPDRAVQTQTSFEETGYGGPCPPEGHGVHHYNFTVHALDTARVDVAADMKPAAVADVLADHQLDKATLTGTYSRD